MFTVPSQQVIDSIQRGSRDVNGINRSLCWQSHMSDQFLCEIQSRRIDGQHRNPIQKEKSFLGGRRIARKTFVDNRLCCEQFKPRTVIVPLFESHELVCSKDDVRAETRCQIAPEHGQETWMLISLHCRTLRFSRSGIMSTERSEPARVFRFCCNRLFCGTIPSPVRKPSRQPLTPAHRA